MATLLIVDDDTLIRDTLHELLSPSHECHTADRAEQALAYLEVETYDAVITDITMPGLSGRDLLKHIQAKHPATPVVVVSGMSNVTDAHELIEMGAFAFFTKPFKLEEIEESVARAIAQHQQSASAAPNVEQASDQTENLPTAKDPD